MSLSRPEGSSTPGARMDVCRRSSGAGRLKVFLGMAAGVGKTYRMLLEGHAEQEAGRDVVVGLLETPWTRRDGPPRRGPAAGARAGA